MRVGAGWPHFKTTPPSAGVKPSSLRALRITLLSVPADPYRLGSSRSKQVGSSLYERYVYERERTPPGSLVLGSSCAADMFVVFVALAPKLLGELGTYADSSFCGWTLEPRVTLPRRIRQMKRRVTDNTPCKGWAELPE